MVEAVFEHGFTFTGFPAGLEAGTPNAAGAVGMAAAARFLEGLGMEAVHAHGEALARRMAAGLAAMPSARLYGPGPDGAEERCGIVAFNVRGVGADLAARALDRRNVAVRAGAHCAQPLARRRPLPRGRGGGAPGRGEPHDVGDAVAAVGGGASAYSALHVGRSTTRTLM